MTQPPSLAAVPAGMQPHVDLVLRGEYAPPDNVDLSGIQTVLDIGANVGAFSVWARWKFPDAHITAVEPMRENARLFALNMARDRKYALHMGAAWPHDGDVSMRVGLHNSGEASIYDLGEQSDKTVPVCTIHPRALPAAHFIKIDCEGAEWEILRHLQIQNAQVIALEWHREEDRGKITSYLASNGFKCVGDRPSSRTRGILLFARSHMVRRKLFVGVPVYGGMHPLFVPGLMQLAQLPREQITVRQVAGDSLVARARNTLAAEFLRSGCTHLLFLDSDLVFGADQVLRLFSHDDVGRSHPIVAGLYPKKQKKLDWVVNLLADETPDARGLHRVRYAGTGCLMIARWVFEAMIQKFPEIAFEPDSGELFGTRWDFFSCGVYHYPDGTRRYLSEDWYFCQRAADLGIPIHADTKVVLKHCGDCVYPLEDPFTPVDSAAAPDASAVTQ